MVTISLPARPATADDRNAAEAEAAPTRGPSAVTAAAGGEGAAGPMAGPTSVLAVMVVTIVWCEAMKRAWHRAVEGARRYGWGYLGLGVDRTPWGGRGGRRRREAQGETDVAVLMREVRGVGQPVSPPPPAPSRPPVPVSVPGLPTSPPFP